MEILISNFKNEYFQTISFQISKMKIFNFFTSKMKIFNFFVSKMKISDFSFQFFVAHYNFFHFSMVIWPNFDFFFNFFHFPRVLGPIVFSKFKNKNFQYKFQKRKFSISNFPCDINDFSRPEVVKFIFKNVKITYLPLPKTAIPPPVKEPYTLHIYLLKVMYLI
jgi:hypothetical protein